MQKACGKEQGTCLWHKLLQQLSLETGGLAPTWQQRFAVARSSPRATPGSALAVVLFIALPVCNACLSVSEIHILYSDAVTRTAQPRRLESAVSETHFRQPTESAGFGRPRLGQSRPRWRLI
jgi:hypothetical protein